MSASIRHAVGSGAMLLALLVVACGPTPPQAPLPFAKKLDEATSGISTSCGENYQLTAFPGASHAQLASIAVAAGSAAEKLVLVYRRDPSWIYQGDTVHEIVAESVSMLQSCGLPSVAAKLVRATARR